MVTGKSVLADSINNNFFKFLQGTVTLLIPLVLSLSYQEIPLMSLKELLM